MERNGSLPGGETPLCTLSYEFVPDAIPVRLLRGAVRSLLAEYGFPEASVESVVLGLDEVLMNACDHASRPRALVSGSVSLLEDRVEMTVLDRGGPGFCAPAEPSLPDPDSESGRGLFLVHHTMDEVSFHSGAEGGTLVRLVKRR